jgi:uncharacterized protein YbaR (Trm112 family)
MKKDFLDILACPTCKAPLELTTQSEKDGEVITGSLRCTKCGTVYPIVDGIPNLLPQTPQGKK